MSAIPRRRSERDLLTRSAWLDAAADVVAESGFASLSVLGLAKRLGVTRGSFYWHFKDREDLVHGVLDEWLAWRRKRSSSLRSVFDRDDPAESLRRLLHIGFGAARYSPRGMRIEAAVRDLAASNDYAAEILAQSDLARHEPTEALFFRLCHDKDRARVLARITYLLVAGSDLVLQGRGRNEQEVRAIEALVGELLERAATPASGD
jgi:AcrR family transcriptional regulator